MVKTNPIEFDFCDLNPASPEHCGYCYRKNGFNPAGTSELLSCIIAYSTIKRPSDGRRCFIGTGKFFDTSIERKGNSGTQCQLELKGDIDISLRADNLLTANGILFGSRSAIYDPELNGCLETCPCGFDLDRSRDVTTLPAFVLFPISEKVLPGREHYKRHSGIEIDMRRGIVSPFNDNPFRFFDRLQQVYRMPSSKRESLVADMGHLPKLDRDIAATWDFWELFGFGDDGFYNYLDCFCLRYFDPQNKSTDVLRTESSHWSPDVIRMYARALKEIERLRGKSILKRCSEDYLARIIQGYELPVEI